MIHYTRFRSGGVIRDAPVADGTSFDGHLFSGSNVVVERIYDPLPDAREELVENNGRHGSSIRSLHLSTRDITLECRYFTGTPIVVNDDGYMSDWYDYESIMQELTGYLHSAEDRRLVLRNHPGQYYMAHLKSIDEGDRDNQTAGFTLSFVATDPLRYEQYERSLVAIGSRQFEVAGTDEAQLSIVARGVAGSPARVELYKFGTSERYPLSLFGGSSPNDVVTYDCVNHVAKCSGSASAGVKGVTLDSKWPILTPGRWEATSNDGTATLTWRQAWR